MMRGQAQAEFPVPQKRRQALSGGGEPRRLHGSHAASKTVMNAFAKIACWFTQRRPPRSAAVTVRGSGRAGARCWRLAWVCTFVVLAGGMGVLEAHPQGVLS